MNKNKNKDKWGGKRRLFKQKKNSIEKIQIKILNANLSKKWENEK